jgi:hypothetical protein
MELRKEHKRPTGTEGRSKPPRRGSLWLTSTRKPVIAQPPHVAELGAIAGDIQPPSQRRQTPNLNEHQAASPEPAQPQH